MPLRAPGDVHGAVLLERAGVDANEAQPLHERVDPRLEHLGRQRRGRIGLERDLVAVLRGRARDGRRRQRSLRQHVEQLVDADVRLGRDADDRRERARRDRLAARAVRSSSFDGISPSKYFSITASRRPR